MKKAQPIIVAKKGRPPLGKVKTRLSFTPRALEVIKKRAFQTGIDASVLAEQLIREKYPEDFVEAVMGKGALQ